MQDAALELLLLGIEPEPPAADAAARIRRRVLMRVADSHAAVSMIDIRRAEGWQPLADKAEMKVLHDDGATMSWLIRMEAGAALEGHDHAGTEECLVLEGDVWLNDERHGPGDYQVAFAGSRHGCVRTDHGCLLFVRSPSPNRAAADSAR
jgi:quercetin dioxygenase-like cupin family protein